MHFKGQADEVIPFYLLCSTFTKHIPCSIQEREEWTAPQAVVGKLERLHRPHVSDLFASRANERFDRFGSHSKRPPSRVS